MFIRGPVFHWESKLYKLKHWKWHILTTTLMLIFSHKIQLVFLIAFFFSYKQALDMLANEEVLAPVYYILGGTKSGEVSEENN